MFWENPLPVEQRWKKHGQHDDVEVGVFTLRPYAIASSARSCISEHENQGLHLNN